MPFTDVGAWEFIAERLEQGEPLIEVELRKPPGATGYEMIIELEPTRAPLYIKLELSGSGKIFGRSFHYSERRS